MENGRKTQRERKEREGLKEDGRIEEGKGTVAALLDGPPAVPPACSLSRLFSQTN